MYNLHDLIDVIIYADLSDDEWREIDKAVDELFKTSSQEEIDEFVESGAGETLDLILEFMEN